MISKITQMKYFKITYAVLLNVAVMALFMSIFELYYELPDDSVFSQLIVDGSYDFHFMNYFICAFIGLVQGIIYPLNAYVFVSLFFSLCAFVAISRVFLDRFNLPVATGIILVINGFFAVNHYETVAFTKMPALLAVAGFLCIIHYANKDKWLLGIVLGGIFVIVGSLYRFEIFAVTVVLALFYVIAKALADYFAIDKPARKVVDYFKLLFEKKRLISVILTLTVCFGAYFASTTITTSTDELAYFTEYTSLRSAVYDYSIPPFEECKDEYEAIGIDENDYNMLKKAYMDDQGAFTPEKLKEVINIQENYNKKNRTLVGTLKLMLISEAGNIRAVWKNGSIPILNNGRDAGGKGILYFLIIIFMAIFVLVMRKRNYFIPVALSLVTFVFYFYLWIDLKVPFRAVYMLLIGTVIFLLYSFEKSQMRPYFIDFIQKNIKLISCSVLVICFAFAGWGTYVTHLYNQHVVDFKPSESRINLTKYLSNNTDKKYELLHGCSVMKNSNSIFTVKKSDLSKNYSNFGSVYFRLPIENEKLKNFGADNLYLNIVNGNIYLIDNSEESQYQMMKTYFEKHYNDNKEISVELIDSFDIYNVYKFSR